MDNINQTKTECCFSSGSMTTPGWWMYQQCDLFMKRERAYLLDNSRKSPPLESDPRIPLGPNRSLHTPLELCSAGVRIWQVLHHVLRCLLIPLLGDDNMRFVVILSRFRIYAGFLLDQMWFWRCFFSSCSTP